LNLRQFYWEKISTPSERLTRELLHHYRTYHLSLTDAYAAWLLLHWLRDVRRAAHLATSEIHKGVGYADALSCCETPDLDVRRLREWEGRDDAMAVCFARRNSMSSSASAISACLINRGGAREKENWRQKSRSRVLEKEFVRVI